MANPFEEELARRSSNPFEAELARRQTAPPIPEPRGIPQAEERSAFRTLDDAVRSLASGATFGLADEIAAAANTATGLGSGQTYEENLAAERARDEAISPMVQIPGEVAGMTASGVAALPLAAATGVTRAAAALSPLQKALMAGGGSGAAYGFGSGEGGLEERLESSAVGGALGLGGTALGRGAARVIRPATRKAVQMLQSMGVTPTPGQALGGVARSVEEKASSIPFLGEMIRGAERRGIEQFNVGTINRALSQAGLSLPKGTTAGREAIEAAGEAISKGYDDVLSGMSAQIDDTFAQQVDDIGIRLRSTLPAEYRDLFKGQVDEVINMVNKRGGNLTGDQAKQVISELSRRAANLRRDPNSFQRGLGEAVFDLRTAFQELLERSSSPDKSVRLRGLDSAYRDFLRLENAAGRIGSAEGVFTPAQLRAATRQMDPSLRKRAFARGQAPMQDIAEAGQDVLARNIPNSGTADRSLMALLAGGGIGAAVEPTTAVALGAGIGVPSLAYQRWAQKMLVDALTRRPAGAQALARGVSTASPLIGFGAAVGGS